MNYTLLFCSVGAFWFLVAIINGINDQRRKECAFWKRPVALIISLICVGLGLLGMFGPFLLGWVYSSIFCIPALFISLIGFLLAFMGGFIAYFIPWISL